MFLFMNHIYDAIRIKNHNQINKDLDLTTPEKQGFLKQNIGRIKEGG